MTDANVSGNCRRTDRSVTEPRTWRSRHAVLVAADLLPSVAVERPFAPAHRKPLREQLRRSIAKTQRDHRAAGGARLHQRARVHRERSRPRFYVSRTQDIAEGATWRDPDRLQDWIGELSKSDPVVVYCAYGFHVGCNTAAKLREAGFDAKYMKPGHSGWKALGRRMRMHP